VPRPAIRSPGGGSPAARHKLWSPDTFLILVAHPRGYTLRHNSNLVIANWRVEVERRIGNEQRNGPEKGIQEETGEDTS
jgi:hypothetical protein